MSVKTVMIELKRRFIMHYQKRFARLFHFCIVMFLFLTAVFVNTFHAADTQEDKPADRWVRKDGYFYYYDNLGKRLTGLQKIGDEAYLFDHRGRQKTGWQKIDGYFSFFRTKNGSAGSMVRGKTVNHITIKKNGRARARSSDTRMALLWRCSRIVEQHSKPAWSKARKMRAVWSWFQSHLGYRGREFHLHSGWDLYYASLTFHTGWASCEGLGCAWAFLANACGCEKCYSVTDTGHGWAEVDGLIYDPACARYDRGRDDYFAMSKRMAGVGGRPACYVGGGLYKNRV